jgi:hypothetical protein
MPSWRAQGPAFWEDYDAVIATDANGRGRNFEVWTYGKSWATRFSLDEAKKSVESIYGPLEWRRVRMPPEVYNHYYFGPTTEFTDPRTIYVVDRLPKLGRLFTFEVDYAYDKDVLMGKEGFPDHEDWSSTVTVEADNEPEARLLAEQMVAARYREPIGVRRVY